MTTGTTPLRVVALERDPCHAIPYLDAAGGHRIERRQLPVLRGRVSGLPDGLDALVLAADLQGRSPGNIRPQRLADGSVLGRNAADPGELLGVEVAAELAARVGSEILPAAPERTLVGLAGDLYVVRMLDKRGGLGPVDAVWTAFAAAFAEVVGVLGNHDEMYGTPAGWLLDGETVRVAGLRVGGVGGIIGNPAKPLRRRPDAYARALSNVLDGAPQLVLLHQSPEWSDPSCPICEMLEVSDDSALIVSGHRYWREPLMVAPSGRQCLNVDGRVVILLRE